MKFKIYVDGSFSVNEPDSVYGAFISLTDDGEMLSAVRYRAKDPEVVAMRNVGGELIAAEGALISMAALIAQNYSKEDIHTVKVYYDYKGIYEFVKPVNPWTPSKRPTRIYAKLVDKVRSDNPNLVFEFVKVKAHAGEKLNEMVDELAKGYTSTELRTVYKGCFDV